MIMEITLFLFAGIGLYALWYSLGLITISKTQLKKPNEYHVLRKSIDTRLLSWFFQRGSAYQTKKSQQLIKNTLTKWQMWSEIGLERPLSLTGLFLQSVFLASVFGIVVEWYTNQFLLTVLFTGLGGVLPQLLLKAKFMSVAHRAKRKGLLPFVDVYKNSYVRTKENIITAFHYSEPDCPKEMTPVLSWLLRRLHNGSSQKEGLREFAQILNSEWGHTFVNYLISGLEGEADNITRSLTQLQLEMHTSRDEEEEREIITIGAFYSNFIVIGLTFLGIVFLASFLPMMKQFFLQTDEGHSLLAFAFVTWIVMIIYSYFRMKGGNI